MFQNTALQLDGSASNFARKKNNDIYPNDEMISGFIKPNTANFSY